MEAQEKIREQLIFEIKKMASYSYKEVEEQEALMEVIEKIKGDLEALESLSNLLEVEVDPTFSDLLLLLADEENYQELIEVLSGNVLEETDFLREFNEKFFLLQERDRVLFKDYIFSDFAFH